MRLFLPIVLLCATVSAQQYLPHKRTAFKVKQPTAPSYEFVEDFEGATETWTESNVTVVNQNAEWGALSGDQSIAITNSGSSFHYGYTNLYIATTYHVRFRWRPLYIYHATAGFTGFSIGRVGFTDDGIVKMNQAGSITFKHGTTVSSAYAAATNTEYFVWFRWTKSTGSDGVYQVWISTTGTKPASPTIEGSDGNGTAYPEQVVCVARYGHCIWDDITIDDEPLGDFPE